MVKCHHSLSNTLLVETSACLTYLPNCPSPTHSNCWLGTYHLGTLVHPFHLAVDQTVVGQVIPLTHRAYIVGLHSTSLLANSFSDLCEVAWGSCLISPIPYSPFQCQLPLSHLIEGILQDKSSGLREVMPCFTECPVHCSDDYLLPNPSVGS